MTRWTKNGYLPHGKRNIRGPGRLQPVRVSRFSRCRSISARNVPASGRQQGAQGALSGRLGLPEPHADLVELLHKLLGSLIRRLAGPDNAAKRHLDLPGEPDPEQRAGGVQPSTMPCVCAGVTLTLTPRDSILSAQSKRSSAASWASWLSISSISVHRSGLSLGWRRRDRLRVIAVDVHRTAAGRQRYRQELDLGQLAVEECDRSVQRLLQLFRHLIDGDEESEVSVLQVRETLLRKVSSSHLRKCPRTVRQHRATRAAEDAFEVLVVALPKSSRVLEHLADDLAARFGLLARLHSTIAIWPLALTTTRSALPARRIGTSFAAAVGPSKPGSRDGDSKIRFCSSLSFSS